MDGLDLDRRCVARTADIAEAERIAETYRLQGFETLILKTARAGLALYEVWVSKEPEIKS
jgi:hypothetical protein